jgi:hypothetical protein
MANQQKTSHRRGHERHISVRTIRKQNRDLRKLSRAIIQYDLEAAAAEAAAQAAANEPPAQAERKDA